MNNNEWTEDPDIQRIVAFVRAYRKYADVTPTRSRKSELSCIQFGEGYNLLFRQLVRTPEFESGWLELEDSPEVVQLVLDEIDRCEHKHPEVKVA